MTKTREEFEAEYNGGDISELILYGRLSIECHCDWGLCEGWKMTSIDRLPDDLYLYGNTSSEIAVALWHRLELLNKLKQDGKNVD